MNTKYRLRRWCFSITVYAETEPLAKQKLVRRSSGPLNRTHLSRRLARFLRLLCTRIDRERLPAEAETITLYLADLGRHGRKPSTWELIQSI
jgi:hypothetical protein